MAMATALEQRGEIGINEFWQYCSGGVGYGFSGSSFLLWWLAFVWVLWFDGMRNTAIKFFFFFGDIFLFFPAVMVQQIDVCSDTKTDAGQPEQNLNNNKIKDMT